MPNDLNLKNVIYRKVSRRIWCSTPTVSDSLLMRKLSQGSFMRPFRVWAVLWRNPVTSTCWNWITAHNRTGLSIESADRNTRSLWTALFSAAVHVAFVWTCKLGYVSLLTTNIMLSFLEFALGQSMIGLATSGAGLDGRRSFPWILFIDGSRPLKAIWDITTGHSCGIKHIHRAPYCSSSNDRAEMFFQMFKRAMKAGDQVNYFSKGNLVLHLDLLKPTAEVRVASKQADQKMHRDKHRELSPEWMSPLNPYYS